MEKQKSNINVRMGDARKTKTKTWKNQTRPADRGEQKCQNALFLFEST